MGTFGQILRQHRNKREMSLRELGRRTNFGFTYLSQVERGERKATKALAELCDNALDADGALITAYGEEEVGDGDMHRRTVLRAMGALAASPVPLVQWEALRHGVAAAANPELDQWDATIADYGVAYYTMPAELMMSHLRADLTVLETLIAAETGPARGHLLRAACRLSVLVALSMMAAGDTIAAARWWRDSRQYARASNDPDCIVFAHAWDVVNGCYDGRSPTRVVELADEVMPLVDKRPTAASCGLLAGRAQALSLAGRHTDAIATLHQLKDVVNHLTSAVVDDVESLWGWPEHRLRHTEAWVYAHAGKLAEATDAQEQAVRLYTSPMIRLSTQVRLHHASALIRAGLIPDGLRRATSLLDNLPDAVHNSLVRAVAQQVLDAVPIAERRQSAFRELTDRVAG